MIGGWLWGCVCCSDSAGCALFFFRLGLWIRGVFWFGAGGYAEVAEGGLGEERAGEEEWPPPFRQRRICDSLRVTPPPEARGRREDAALR